jgi:hypothetical protein
MIKSSKQSKVERGKWKDVSHCPRYSVISVTPWLTDTKMVPLRYHIGTIVVSIWYHFGTVLAHCIGGII